jgi:hypothetical protein
VHRGPL